MSNEKIQKTKTIEHPMEQILDIEPGTTLVHYEESLPVPLIEHEEYDEKDNEIEQQFQEVYEKAMDAFDAQSDITDTVEGKYAARNAEVSVQFLNTALAAAKEKSGLKQHKDKLEVSKAEAGKPKAVNNNLILDRNELLRLIQSTKEKEVN